MKKRKVKKYRIKVNDQSQMDLISIVDSPAIEVKGMLFSENKMDIKFKSDKEKKEIFAPFLIPYLEIPRWDDEEEEWYTVYFDKESIEELILKYQKQNTKNKINFNHGNKIVDGFIKELWIKETKEDKSNKYFADLPIGTAFMIVKIEDDKFWENEVKNLGFDSFSVEIMADLELENELSELEFNKIELESYNDYPEAAKENAKRALKWAEENGWGSCGTPVGKQRANQLANGENISEETIARMSSFERHRQNSKVPYEEGCGGLMWDAWGGDEGIAWAQRKLKQIREEKLYKVIENMSEDEILEVIEEFVIEPKSGETEEEFVGRCIAVEINNGYPDDQAAAICYMKWEETKK